MPLSLVRSARCGRRRVGDRDAILVGACELLCASFDPRLEVGLAMASILIGMKP